MKPRDKKILLTCIIINFATVALIAAFLVCMHYSAMHYFNFAEKEFPEEGAALSLFLFLLLVAPITFLGFCVTKIGLLAFVSFFLLSGILLAVYAKTKSPKMFKVSTHTAVASSAATMFIPFFFIIFEVEQISPNFIPADIGLIVCTVALAVICTTSIILHTLLFYGVKKANEPIAPEDPFTQL